MRPSKLPSIKAALCLAAASLLLSGCATTPRIASIDAHFPRMKGVQILVLESRDIQGIRSELERYKKAGFDTVILRAFHMTGDRLHGPAASSGTSTLPSEGVYFKTERAPVLMNILGPFVRISHELDMKAYAWMVTRMAAFSNTDLPTDVEFSAKDGMFHETDSLDILSSEVKPYLAGIFMDLAATGVDGILLQDDMVSRMGDGFTKANMARYRKDTGDRFPPYRFLRTRTGSDGRTYTVAERGFSRWVRWKTSRIVSLAHSLERSARLVNPEIFLAQNLTYEAVTDPDNGRLWLSQDLQQVLVSGPSYAALMLYHRQIQYELEMGFNDVLKMVEQSLSGLEGRLEQRSRVILKFQTRDWKTGATVPPEDLLSALLTAWGGGWSIALVPPPDQEQLSGVAAVLGEW